MPEHRSELGTAVSWRVDLEVEPGKLDEFCALMKDMVDAAGSESGVVIYERFVSADDSRVHVHERFDSSAAAIEHLKLFSSRFSERFEPLVRRRRFVVYGAADADLRRMLEPLEPEYLALLDGFSRAG